MTVHFSSILSGHAAHINSTQGQPLLRSYHLQLHHHL